MGKTLCKILITLFDDPSVALQIFADEARELSKIEALIAIRVLIGYIQKMHPTSAEEMRKDLEECAEFMRTSADVFVVNLDEVSKEGSN